MAIIGMVNIQSHGISSWQKKEENRLANMAAKKTAEEERRLREKNRRESANARSFDLALVAYRRQLSREIGRKLTRAERRQSRQDFLAKWN